MNVVAYTRVSTEEQGDSRAGLEAQRAAIVAAAAAREWTVREFYEEVASGSTLARPMLASARTLCDQQKWALVVSKLDRLSRSLLDFAGIMAEARSSGYQIVALDLGVDTSTPAGEMMANVLATFAQFERRLISQRTRDALAAKRAQGVRLGRPPAIPAATRALVHTLAMSDMGARAIAEYLDAAKVPTVGGKSWQASTIRRVLAGRP